MPAHLFAPVVFGEFADIRVPVFAFFFAPVNDAGPGSIDGPCGANRRRHHAHFAFETPLVPMPACDEDHAVATGPTLRGTATGNRGIAARIHVL